jgi:hypothetical protein
MTFFAGVRSYKHLKAHLYTSINSIQKSHFVFVMLTMPLAWQAEGSICGLL